MKKRAALKASCFGDISENATRLGNAMWTHCVNLQHVCNKRAKWSFLKISEGIKRKRPNADVLFKKCTRAKSSSRAEHWEEFPFCLGSLSDHSAMDDGCQESLWAQLANKRPSLLLGAVPALVDSPTNTAGAPFNLLPSSLQTISLTSSVNSTVCASRGVRHLFCMYLQCTGLQSRRRLERFQPGWFTHTPRVVRVDFLLSWSI